MGGHKRGHLLPGPLRRHRQGLASDIGLAVHADLGQTFAELLDKHSPEAKVAFVSFGRYTVFK